MDKVIPNDIAYLGFVAPRIDRAHIIRIGNGVVNFVVLNNLIVSKNMDCHLRQMIDFVMGNAVSDPIHPYRRTIGGLAPVYIMNPAV